VSERERERERERESSVPDPEENHADHGEDGAQRVAEEALVLVAPVQHPPLPVWRDQALCWMCWCSAVSV
jgi:hypothetical protein